MKTFIASDGENCSCCWTSYFDSSSYVLNEYDIALFYSPYYSAENDNIEVRYRRGYTIGWLITSAYFQENDDSIISANSDNLNKFALIGGQYLLKKLLLSGKMSDGDDMSQKDLSHFHVLVYRKSVLGTDCILNIIPQLYGYGFYYLSEIDQLYEKFYDSEYLKERIIINKRTKISLSSVEYDADLKKLINELYAQILPFASSFIFTRYFFLYQIIELKMELEFEHSLYKHIKEYNSGVISKNSLREKLSSDTEEKSKINLVFEGISGQEVDDFMDAAEQFLQDLGRPEHNSSLPQLIYSVRNVLVHNFRLTIDLKEEFKKVEERFELVMVKLLTKSNPDTAYEHFVVCDIRERYKTNKRRMRQTYVENKYRNL